jgi:hypothetical protein
MGLKVRLAARVAAPALALLFVGSVTAGCGAGSSSSQGADSASTPVPPEIPTPLLEFENPLATKPPFENRRDGAFPVKLLPPNAPVSVWTTVRLAGDAGEHEEVLVITEGFVEAEEGYVFDYDITYMDAEGNEYETPQNLEFGLLAAGERRKFGVAAYMPSASKLVELRITPTHGDIAGQVTYVLKLPVANIPRSALLPEGYEEAQ